MQHTYSIECHKQLENLTLPEIASKDGYTCKARSSHCLVYLPRSVTQKIFIKTASDLGLHPKLQANEILLTSVLHIYPEGMTFRSDEPAIIELMKTVKLNNQNPDQKLVPLFSNSDPLKWKELASHDCEMLEDRVTFKTTHFSYFVVIARFQFPSAKITVEPEVSQPAELKIPELPGFKVEIPPTSVQSNTEITATVRYDDPELYDRHSTNHSLATTCISLEPHNAQFEERVSITIPVPNYYEIIKEYPDIILELWHAKVANNTRTSGDDTQIKWELIEDANVTICCDGDGNWLATAYVTHFSWFKYLWNKSVNYCLNFLAQSVHGRCQVFMSNETKHGSFITFGIAVLLYPFQDPYRTLQNHHYILYDSELPVEFLAGKVECRIELDDSLLLQYQSCHNQRCYKQCCMFSKDFYARADFSMRLDAGTESQLPAGVLAALFIEHGSDVEPHKFNLIKVNLSLSFMC